jgi:hypothetical protein
MNQIRGFTQLDDASRHYRNDAPILVLYGQGLLLHDKVENNKLNIGYVCGVGHNDFDSLTEVFTWAAMADCITAFGEVVGFNRT